MTLNKEKLTDVLSALMAQYDVILPAGEGKRQKYTPWDGCTAPNFAGNTPIPPKDVLFPQSESMYNADLKSGEIQEPPIGKKQVLVGVRPCDVRSIGNMDLAFLEGQYSDSNYEKRRANLTIIAMACTSIPSAACFCDSMGGDPMEAPLADILLTETESGYSLESLTDKGRAIEERWKDLISKKTPKKPKPPHCELRVDKPENLAQTLISRFEDPMWAELSEGCLGCGCCTYVCPTCYCFDIDSETKGSDVTTFRCWDSCMFSDYSRMAGGHNPRPTKKERLRNRYLHKLAYFDERYGKTLCVGCGRCVLKCPAGLDITNVITCAAAPAGGENQ